MNRVTKGSISSPNLYHVEVSWPKQVPIKWTGLPVVYSKHAIDRCTNKGIQPKYILNGEAFEVEYTEGRISKIALRCKYSNTHDLCAVVSNTGLVITCWLNAIDDKHGTLNRTKYTSKSA